MKQFSKHVLPIILAVMLVASMALPVAAASDADEPERASAYITSCYADVTLKSGGKIDIYFRITGTDTMTSLGATDIIIFNESNGCVGILNSTNTSGLMGYNTFFYSNTVTWSGAVAGTRYYAFVVFKAQDSSGYDTTSYTTLYT